MILSYIFYIMQVPFLVVLAKSLYMFVEKYFHFNFLGFSIIFWVILLKIPHYGNINTADKILASEPIDKKVNYW